jgi:hypothetical protein
MQRVVDSPYRESESRRLRVSLSRGVVFRIGISPRIRSQNRNGSKCSVRDLCRTDLCKNLGKSGSFPCLFKTSPPQTLQKNCIQYYSNCLLLTLYLNLIFWTTVFNFFLHHTALLSKEPILNQLVTESNDPMHRIKLLSFDLFLSLYILFYSLSFCSGNLPIDPKVGLIVQCMTYIFFGSRESKKQTNREKKGRCCSM